MRLANLVALACISSVFFTGCDQISSKLATLGAPPTPVEMATKLDKLMETGAYKKVIKEGEAYLDKNQDPDGEVSGVVIDAYVASGDTKGVLSHIEKYRVSRDSQSEKVAKSSSASSNMNQQETNQNTNSGVVVDGAGVIHTKRGTVVRAGDAVVVMPK